MVSFTIFLLLIFLIGLSVTYKIWEEFKLEEKIFIGFTLGLIIVNFQVFLVALFLKLNYISIFSPVFVDLLILGFLLRPLPKFYKSILKDIRSYRLRSNLNFWLLIIGLGLIFLFLLEENMLKVLPGGMWATGTHDPYGDVPGNLNMISSFAYGDNFPPELTIFPGIPLSYYFMSNFFSAIALYLSNNFQFCLILPSLILFVLLVGLLFLFTNRVLGDKIASFLTPIIFLFNGGLGFLYLVKESQEKGQSVINTILTTTHSYSYLPVWNIQLPVLIGAVFLAQRALLFSLPTVVIILFLLWLSVKEISWENSKKNLIMAGFLTGFLPLLSTYAFLNFAIFAPTLFLLFFFKKNWKRFFQVCFYFSLPAILLSLPQLFLLLPGVISAHSGFRFDPSWMGKENLLIFWIKNLGLIVPLILFSAFYKKIITWQLKIFVLPALLVFIIFNLIVLQPWAWDNLKLFWYPFIFVAMLTASAVAFIFRKNLLLGSLVFALVIFSGTLSTYAHTKEKWGLFSKGEQETAAFIRNNLPKNVIFLTAPIHNQLVSSLAGRKIFMGWWGYLWTRGIDYKTRETELNDMLAGKEDGFTLLKKNKIDYVVIGPNEISNFGANLNFYSELFPIVYQNSGYTIFKII